MEVHLDTSYEGLIITICIRFYTTSYVDRHPPAGIEYLCYGDGLPRANVVVQHTTVGNMKPRRTTFEERCAELKARLNPPSVAVEVPVDLHELFLPIVGQVLQHQIRPNEIRVKVGARLVLDRSTGRNCKPDVMVLRKEWGQGKEFFPVVTVEIKAPNDTFDNLIDKCLEYERLAVTNISNHGPLQQAGVVFHTRKPSPYRD